MRRLFLFSNGTSKVTTRVVPVRFRRARPDGDPVQAGHPPIDDRIVDIVPTTSIFVNNDGIGSVSSFQVAIERPMLDDTAPIVVAAPEMFSVAHADSAPVPAGPSAAVTVGAKPHTAFDFQEDFSQGILRVHAGSLEGPVIGRLSVKGYKKIRMRIIFHVLGIKTASQAAEFPFVTDGQIFKYLQVVNAIYEPAGVVFEGVIHRAIIPSDFAKAGTVSSDLELAATLRDARTMLRRKRQVEKGKPDKLTAAEDSAPSRALRVCIVDTISIKSLDGLESLEALGVPQVWVENRYAAQLFGNDGKNFDARSILLKSVGISEWQRSEEAVKWKASHGDSGLSESPQKLEDYQSFMARNGILYDYNRGLRKKPLAMFSKESQAEFARTQSGGAYFAVTFNVPGAVIGIPRARAGEADYTPDNFQRWGKTIAHELGHVLGLIHPNDPKYDDDTYRDDLWTRMRMMSHRRQFPAGTQLVDWGYGPGLRGTLLTQYHVECGDIDKDPRTATFLDPLGGEVEALRQAIRKSWAHEEE